MRNKSLVICVVMVLMSLCISLSAAMAAEGPVQLGTQPVSMTFNEDNYLVVQPANTPGVLMFWLQDKGFPIGTQTRIKEVTNQNGSMFTIEYLVPGSIWSQLLWNQLKCKDDACKKVEPTTPTPPEPPQEPEKFTCGGWGALLGAGVGAGLGSIHSESNANGAHAETQANPLLGALGGAALGAGIDCAIQYAQWKKAHR